jgi:hypothetical protein
VTGGERGSGPEREGVRITRGMAQRRADPEVFALGVIRVPVRDRDGAAGPAGQGGGPGPPEVCDRGAHVDRPMRGSLSERDLIHDGGSILNFMPSAPRFI